MAILPVTIVVEGPTDLALIQRVFSDRGLSVGPIHGLRGKDLIDRQILAYNRAAEYQPWLQLRDLDSDAECAPALLVKLLPSPARHMHLRIPVRSAEAWLLADVVGISEFMRVSRRHVPRVPESLPDPKAALIALARRSTNRALKEDIVPIVGSRA